MPNSASTMSPARACAWIAPAAVWRTSADDCASGGGEHREVEGSLDDDGASRRTRSVRGERPGVNELAAHPPGGPSAFGAAHQPLEILKQNVSHRTPARQQTIATRPNTTRRLERIRQSRNVKSPAASKISQALTSGLFGGCWTTSHTMRVPIAAATVGTSGRSVPRTSWTGATSRTMTCAVFRSMRDDAHPKKYDDERDERQQCPRVLFNK
jgi:hypothetical protein